MSDYNRISHETLDFLEYAKRETPEITFITLINPAEETVTVCAQKITSTVLRREQRYTFKEFLTLTFEKIHKSLLLKFEEFPYCSHCERITDPGCVENCDLFKTLKDKEGLMFKVIDYAGETVKEGFGSAAAAYHYLALTFSADFIHEMQFRVMEDSEKWNEWVSCGECEDHDSCPDAVRFDGCVLGVRTPTKEGGGR